MATATRAATPDRPEVGEIARAQPLPHPLPGQRAGHPRATRGLYDLSGGVTPPRRRTRLAVR